MVTKKKSTNKKAQTAKTRLDPNAWLERAQAVQAYSSALKDADTKAFEFYSSANEQIKKQFEFSRKLYVFSLILIIFLLAASLAFAIFSRGNNQFYQTFSVVVGGFSITILIVLLIRNPLSHASYLLDKTMRVNVAFLSFVRRLQQSDLAIRFVYMQTQRHDFSKILVQIQELQNAIDQTSEEITQIMQDLG